MRSPSLSNHPFTFRPGTFDEGVYKTTVLDNEYQLRDRFQPDDIIIDIGAHIGSFSYAVLIRGANHVYAFEADPANYACAVKNLKGFGGRVTLRHKAVWRSDREIGKLFLVRDAVNTGSSTTYGESGESVEAVPFDQVLLEVTDNGRKHVELVKLDCEGAEFPILLSSRNLHLINNICGEYHLFDTEAGTDLLPEVARIPGIKHFSLETLSLALEKAGFKLQLLPSADEPCLGLFFGTR